MRPLHHILAVAIACWSAAATAQEPPGAPEAGADAERDALEGEGTGDASMDELNARGFAAFDRGDFIEAAAIFMAAHEIYGDPNLLKNAAIAYYAAERCDRARQNALAFLKDPDALAADREEMTRLIGRCDALAEAELERQEELEQLEPPPKKDEETSASKTLGGVLMGVGSATLVGTVIYHAYAFQESEELREISLMGGDARRYAELSSSVDTARVVVPTLYAVSGALIGGGAWLVFRPERDEETQQTRVSVHLGYTTRF